MWWVALELNIISKKITKCHKTAKFSYLDFYFLSCRLSCFLDGPQSGLPLPVLHIHCHCSFLNFSVAYSLYIWTFLNYRKILFLGRENLTSSIWHTVIIIFWLPLTWNCAQAGMSGRALFLNTHCSVAQLPCRNIGSF